MITPSAALSTMLGTLAGAGAEISWQSAEALLHGASSVAVQVGAQLPRAALGQHYSSSAAALGRR